MRYVPLVLALIVGFRRACHPGPVVDTTPQRSVGGTIAGIVTTADSTVAVPGRKVTAIEVSNGSRYDATTAANGGYTIKVPEGTYRLEIELRIRDAVQATRADAGQQRRSRSGSRFRDHGRPAATCGDSHENTKHG